MIGTIEVVHPRDAAAWPRTTGVALIAIATPGCTIVAPPSMRALHASFDSLAGELEAASLRLPGAAAAVPFAREHAQHVWTFLADVARDSRSVTLLVTESEGLTRSVTIARWAAQLLGIPLREPASAGAVASCALMERALLASGGADHRPWAAAVRTARRSTPVRQAFPGIRAV
jgi:hypothetical protein